MLVVDRIGIEARPAGAAAVARMRAGDRDPITLEIAVGEHYADALRADGSPWLAATLLPAMMTGTALAIDAPVSPRLVAGAEVVGEHLRRHWGDRYGLRAVTIDAPAAAPARAPDPARAASFSRGIDSLYTVAGDRPPGPGRLTHLLYSPTIDVLGDAGDPGVARRRGEMLTATERAAATLGLPLIAVDTNLRALHESYAGWVYGYAGSLAAIGHALRGLLGEVWVSTAYTPAQGRPWVSDPALATALSTEACRVRHVGADATRLDKVEALRDRADLLAHLHVCIDGGGARNCGGCEKCLRTQIELHVAGAPDGAPGFDRRIDPGALSEIELSPGSIVFWRDLLERLRPDPAEAQLVDGIRALLERARRAR